MHRWSSQLLCYTHTHTHTFSVPDKSVVPEFLTTMEAITAKKQASASNQAQASLNVGIVFSGGNVDLVKLVALFKDTEPDDDRSHTG